MHPPRVSFVNSRQAIDRRPMAQSTGQGTFSEPEYDLNVFSTSMYMIPERLINKMPLTLTPTHT